MTQNNGNTPTVEVKPQPDVYTLLLIVAIIAVGVSFGLCLHDLLGTDGGYGLKFGQLFDGTLPDLQ